jgi:hypothetical protein
VIKLVYCISKKRGLTDEEFFQYWLNVHAPIGARIPGLRKLVQSHGVTVPGDQFPPDYAAWRSFGLTTWNRCWRRVARRNGKNPPQTRQILSIMPRLLTWLRKSTSSWTRQSRSTG